VLDAAINFDPTAGARGVLYVDAVQTHPLAGRTQYARRFRDVPVQVKPMLDAPFIHGPSARTPQIDGGRAQIPSTTPLRVADYQTDAGGACAPRAVDVLGLR
jgi:hypothetical protein